MLKRKGDTNVDWAISLGIFILYLAWFFIFVRPTFSQQQKPDYLTTINNNFKDATTWTVYRYPIFVNSNFSLTDEPIVVPYNLPFNKSYVFMVNQTFFLSDKIIFVADVTNNSVFYLLNSGEAYEPFHEVTDLTASSSYVTTTNFSATFSNGLLQSAGVPGQQINGFSITVDGSNLNTNNNTFASDEAAAQFAIFTPNLNHFSYVFEKNSRIYSYIEQPQDNFSIALDYSTGVYDSYFINNANFGSIAGGCTTGQDRILDLYTNSSNLLFVFDNPVSIDFCLKNTTIDVQFNFSTANVSSYKVIFFNGAYTDAATFANPYTATFGIPETVTGLSYLDILNLSSVDYTLRKSEWGTSDFRISVGNFSYGGVPFQNANIYSLEYNAFIVDEFANLQNATVNIQSWTS